MESRRARGEREVSNADKVPAGDAIAMPLQSIECTPQQTGIDLTMDTFRSSKREPGSRPGSKGGNRKIKKKTPRKYQDIQLQHK